MTRHDDLLILAYAGISPAFAAPPLHAGTGAAVLGRATVGRGAWLGAGSVIRADGNYVRIGDDFRMGARSTIHIAHGVFPTEIGSGVTAGSNTVIHACTVGDACHLGDDVVILDGSLIEANCALASGSIVFPRSTLEGGWFYEGMPARPVRRLADGELDRLHRQSRATADRRRTVTGGDLQPGMLFLAVTARIAGRVATEGDNGIWFGCDLDAGANVIRVGRNTNIQDNTTIRCEEADVTIGRETTIGHNVTLTDCTVGDRSLVGIGAVVAPGTRIGSDAFLAAGACTEPGQVLDDGGFYAGRPARLKAPLDAAKRATIARTWPTYCDYARSFAEAQQEALDAGPASHS